MAISNCAIFDKNNPDLIKIHKKKKDQNSKLNFVNWYLIFIWYIIEIYSGSTMIHTSNTRNAFKRPNKLRASLISDSVIFDYRNEWNS